jgi:LysM repeat protein
MTRDLEQKLRLMLFAAAAVGGLACASAGAQRPVTPRAIVAPPRVSASPPETRYVVQAGESLSQIASCSGVAVADLARSNGIPDPNRLQAGAALVLPEHHHCGRESAAARAARLHASSLLARASASLDAADFDEALWLGDACVQKLLPYELDAKANALRARCHVVAGTAATGLDRSERAIEEFRRALALDPQLELASDTTSPRVRELAEIARRDP